MASKQTLILASASPRRASLLRSVGVEFSIIPADIVEVRDPLETPSAYVERLAREKAQVIFNSLEEQQNTNVVVLAADTTVAMSNEILEKPTGFDDAQRMWGRLSGAHHDVFTGVCVLSKSNQETIFCCSRVFMDEISSQAMQQYWESGEPQDKAGAYAIQGLASAWVNRVEGSFTNIVGLPLFEVNHLLTRYRLNWL
ncbi:MAG: Maf family protein [Pseudomonadota bacterium]